ncbi:condensation domain-containing protein [Streptomyces tricolor]|nr:condensation domain-containing protein [Streptomyces tricolor]
MPELRWPERPAPGETGTGHLDVSVPPSVTARLDARAAALGASRFVVLLSAWADTLAEVCGQRDFAVGVPVAERTLPELEQTVGCLITMVPVRLRGAAVDGGEDGVRETGNCVHRAFSRSDVPLHGRGPEQRAGHARPPAGVPVPVRPPGQPAAPARPARRRRHASAPAVRRPPLELHLEVWPDEHGTLDAVLSYRRDTVTAATAGKLLDGFHDRLALLATGAPS